MLIFKNISKNYGKVQALMNFSACLKHGIYGLLGSNGAGKTTLIKILVGVLKADRGCIHYKDKNLQSLGKAYLSILGYLPQNARYYPNFRVIEFLLYMCAMKGIPYKLAKLRAFELLETVNLTEAQDYSIDALSGGMLQRLGIAQAMLNNPEILILDEPTAGLDPKERIRFRNIISSISRDRIILLSTHIVSDIESIAHEVLLMRKGHLILQNTPEALSLGLEGKVWQIEVDEPEALEYTQKYNTSNIFREENRFKLRLVSDEKPSRTATSLKANLEDVFLYYNYKDENA